MNEEIKSSIRSLLTTSSAIACESLANSYRNEVRELEEDLIRGKDVQDQLMEAQSNLDIYEGKLEKIYDSWK